MITMRNDCSVTIICWTQPGLAWIQSQGCPPRRRGARKLFTANWIFTMWLLLFPTSEAVRCPSFDVHRDVACRSYRGSSPENVDSNQMVKFPKTHRRRISNLQDYVFSSISIAQFSRKWMCTPQKLKASCKATTPLVTHPHGSCAQHVSTLPWWLHDFFVFVRLVWAHVVEHFFGKCPECSVNLD